MENLIPITYLNDFIFCPYSIYLHQIFDNGDTETFQAAPQSKGLISHYDIDHLTEMDCSRKISGIYVYSSTLKVYGKIDILDTNSNMLIERKREIKTVYQGYLYQLWAQYFALTEMGYNISSIVFESKLENKLLPQELPTQESFRELKQHILKIAMFNPNKFSVQNQNKCSHCIYSSLCDKTIQDHVYS
ncbi:MAG: type V CRISPR-associated protein Cas4 [Bacteroidales bacterium]